MGPHTPKVLAQEINMELPVGVAETQLYQQGQFH